MNFFLHEMISLGLNMRLTRHVMSFVLLSLTKDLTKRTPLSSNVSLIAQIRKPMCAGRPFCGSCSKYDE